MKHMGGVIAMIAVAMVLAAAPAVCQGAMSPDDARTFDGRVVSVDPVASLLTVRGGITMTFPITSRTVITKDNAAIRLYQINPGDYVVVGYYKGGDDPVATTVNVKYSKR